MIKLLLRSALGWLFLTAALPAAFSEPAEAPVKDPDGGVTRISFTRMVEDPQGYKEETVTFYGRVRDSSDSYKVTRSLTTHYNARDRAQEEQSSLFRGSDRNGRLEFLYLTKLLASAKFFEFRGDNTVTALRTYALSPWVRISAIRNGTTKTISMDSAPPEGMWALQAALRGVAADIDWQKVEKTAEADGVKPK